MSDGGPTGRGDEVLDDEPDERDPGLAAERTQLAWGRSALALFACGAAVVKGVPKVTGDPSHPAVGMAVLVLGGIVWLSDLPYSRMRAHATRQGNRPAAQRHELLPMAAGAALVGVAAFVIGLFLPG